MRSIGRVHLDRRSRRVLEVLSLQDTEPLPVCISAFTSMLACLYAYWAQGNGGGGQSDEAAISGVGLVDSVGVFVTELVHNLGYPVVVLCGECISDKAFELEGAALAFVVELVIQGFGDIDIHVQCAAQQLLHGGAVQLLQVLLTMRGAGTCRGVESGQTFGAVVLPFNSMI